jgi:ppGpp synthetase/RelA/SpoT-type nucleotidyltranferase
MTYIMSDERSGLTRSQINKLGRRLKTGQSPSDEDLRLWAAYQDALQSLVADMREEMERACRAVLPGELYEPTSRDKQLRSIVAKLQRPGITTQLANMQDTVGFRVVVPRALDQEALVNHLRSTTDWKVIDRRQRPSHGYRAVHLVQSNELGSCECQVRTRLQHQWAELSERMDRIVEGTKYGAGDPGFLAGLTRLSNMVATFEALELRADPDMPEEIGAVRAELVRFFDDLLQSPIDEFRS